MKALIGVLGFCALAGSAPAWAWGGLQGQTIDGFGKYCTYSDGGVLTVGATELCPITNQEQSSDFPGPGYAPGPGQGPGTGSMQRHRPPPSGGPIIDIENRNGGFGTLSGQGTNGSNRYCYYTDKAVITVGVTELCPLTDQ